MTGSRRIAVEREDVAALMSRAMAGRQTVDRGLPFEVAPGNVKTYAVEVNIPHEDLDAATTRAKELLEGQGLNFHASGDPAMVIAWSESVALFIDLFDPRFWLVHTTSSAVRTQQLLRSLVWTSATMDWCWFPGDILRRMQNDGETRWFKSDFRGDELLAKEPAEARRLKVQLEGDQAQRLFNLLGQSPEYRSSAALTAVALRLGDGGVGRVDEAAHYRGRFVARGDSFEVHLGFVARWVQEYASAVREVEQDHRITWGPVGDNGAFSYSGHTATIGLGRPILDLDHFAASLFSCRDPFRLWAVPRSSGPDAVEAEVVDLHLGQQLRMDITRDWIRIYLPHDACGNTLFRLVSNLQHRYDATITVPRYRDTLATTTV